MNGQIEWSKEWDWAETVWELSATDWVVWGLSEEQEGTSPYIGVKVSCAMFVEMLENVLELDLLKTDVWTSDFQGRCGQWPQIKCNLVLDEVNIEVSAKSEPPPRFETKKDEILIARPPP